MHEFQYAAPTTLQSALTLLAQQSTSARPLAGGTDLIDQMRVGRMAPKLVIDVKKIAELNVLSCDSQGLRVGAAVPCYRISEQADIRRDYAALADSCAIIGGVQIQSRATVGGNLCTSGPAGDTTPSVIALGGICVIAGPGGTREVPAEAFCTAPGKNVLQPGELLVELRFPAPAAHSGSHYRRLIPRNEMDIAVVGVGVHVTLDKQLKTFSSVRLALGAVAPTPLLVSSISQALAGQAITDAAFTQAGELARAAASPITDMRGTQEYRLHVTGVLVERALRAAVDRARGQTIDYRPGH